MKKLAIVISHPIQYYAPVFQQLAKVCAIKVFYTLGKNENEGRYDLNFKRVINWDIPLLEGYEYEFLTNTAKKPGSHHFNGIINPLLIQKLKDFDPSVILIYGWSHRSHLSVMRYFKHKIPVWFRGDSNLLDEKKNILKQYLRYFFLKWIYRHIDKALYVGRANMAYYEKFGLKRKQLSFAPHSIDNIRFAEDRSKEVLQFRNQLGIKSAEILILFAGKLEPKKNPELLLKAFVTSGLSNCHLLFVGNGILEEKLKAESRNQKSKSKYIHFLNFQNQSKMPVVYQACDLFCLPSQGPAETWGLAVNEAMAAGKALLVSTKVGCATDLVKPSINGDIFKSQNIIDLAHKLRALTKSKEKLNQMGTLSQEMIQNWSLEKQVKVIVDTLYNNHAK